MYQQYYGLSGDPFRLSPDHAFCYRHPSFAKGRAYMQYALQAAEGFVVITGAPGMGKTTLISDLLADYGPSDYLVAMLVNTMLKANDILRSTAYEFGIDVQGLDTATVLQRLKQLFVQSHAAGRPPLLVVDEAQNLSLDALEELRLLTNLQSQGKPLLQIFLVGQEGLRDKLQDPKLEQLRQRVTAAAHLYPLSQEQTAAYVIHRLRVVGWDNNPRIRASVLPVIEAACQGVPRRINQFCSRLLLHGAVEEKSVLNADDANMVFQELAEERLSRVPAATSSRPDPESTAVPDVRAPSTVAESREQESIFAHAEDLLQQQRKVVMPAPRRAAATDQVTMPGYEETYPGYARSPRPPRPEPWAGPGGAGEGWPRPQQRPPRGPALGYAMAFLVFLLALGAYAWYQYDRRSMTSLLGDSSDALLPSSGNALPPGSTAAPSVAAEVGEGVGTSSQAQGAVPSEAVPPAR
jgi:type II secretory pathway predicted ATPase ExeA